MAKKSPTENARISSCLWRHKFLKERSCPGHGSWLWASTGPGRAGVPRDGLRSVTAKGRNAPGRGCIPSTGAGEPRCRNARAVCASVLSHVTLPSVSATSARLPLPCVCLCSCPREKGKDLLKAAAYQQAPTKQAVPTAGTKNNYPNHPAEEPSAKQLVFAGVSI